MKSEKDQADAKIRKFKFPWIFFSFFLAWLNIKWSYPAALEDPKMKVAIYELQKSSISPFDELNSFPTRESIKKTNKIE